MPTISACRHGGRSRRNNLPTANIGMSARHIGRMVELIISAYRQTGKQYSYDYTNIVISAQHIGLLAKLMILAYRHNSNNLSRHYTNIGIPISAHWNGTSAYLLNWQFRAVLEKYFDYYTNIGIPARIVAKLRISAYRDIGKKQFADLS